MTKTRIRSVGGDSLTGEASLRFQTDAGVLVRGTVRRMILSLAHLMDLKITLGEDRGWFSSTFVGVVEGPTESVLKFQEEVSSLSN